MADKIFRFSLLNDFRWVNKNPTYDVRYNSRPFDDRQDNNCLAGPYFQKWQTNDTGHAQFLSDYPLTLKFYRWDNDQLFSTVPINANIDFPILDVTFQCYEAEVDFSAFPTGKYYGEISYTDDNDNVIIYQTSPLDVRVKHQKTLLYEYWNSYNDKGAIFDTGMRFNIRIEGNIRDYTPSSDDELFTDQNYNTTTENSIPYRVFSNFIGRAEGLPDWIIDKMNMVFSVDSKSIDGTFYNKVSGQKFEMVRPSQIENEWGYMSIKIIQQDNFFLQQYKTGQIPEGDFVVIKLAKNYKDNGANIVCANVFKTYSNLIRIAIINKGANAFTLKVGTSAGGNEINEFDVSADITHSLDIGHFFNAPTTIYLSGLDGTNCDISLDYNQYDNPAIPVGISTATAKFPKGYLGFYQEVDPGDFNIHWNLGTFMGRPGTAYEGCTILGKNGTKSKPYLQIWDPDVPAARDTNIGNAGNEVEITRSVLPDEGIALFAAQVNSTNGDTINTTDTVARADDQVTANRLGYELHRANIPATLGISEHLGEGDPLNITPDSIITLAFLKLTD